MASASVAGMMWEGSSHADTLNTIPQPDTVRGKADSVSARKVVSQAGKPQESDTTGTKAAADSIPQRAYTILPDTSLRDSLYKDTVRKSKSALEEPVSYSAKDSITFDYTNSRAHLFGGSQVNYQNLQLTADDISLSLDSSLVHASGRPDSTGAIQGKPLFKQGEDEYEPDRISYNFKTRKAFISNVYTQEGEGFMQSREGKRDSSGVMYVQNGKYTTCDAEHPHFYVSLTRAKMHPGKNVITRAVGTEEDVEGDLYHLTVRRDDCLLLCSDGLSNEMADQEMLFEVAHGVRRSDCCRRLLNIAKNRGAPDNVTVVLAQC